MASIEVKVPDIGDFDEVAVIELLVKPGDTVKAEQSLVTVESDKASMEIPSSSAGVVKELKVKIGDKVKEGSVLLVLEGGGAAAESRPAAAAPAPAAQVPAAPPPQPSPKGEGSQAIEIRVPDIGDFKDVAVIELLVKPGDTVKVEQSLLTVESDKASMEIPSSTGRCGQGAQGKDRRQGQRWGPDRGAGRHSGGRPRSSSCRHAPSPTLPRSGSDCCRRSHAAYGGAAAARTRRPDRPAASRVALCSKVRP